MALRTDFTYEAWVLSVYDGDTLKALIATQDFGFETYMVRKKSIRFADINCPEVRGEEREAGLLARDFVRDRIKPGDLIRLTTKKVAGKYGRYVAYVMYYKKRGEWVNLNEELLQEGHAEAVSY